MALTFTGDLRLQAGQIVSATDDGDGSTKRVRIPAVTVVDQSGNAVGGSTASSPTYSTDAAAAKTDRSVTASTASQQAAAANASRKRLIIQNQDAAIAVYVNLGAAATAGIGSLLVAPGATLRIDGSTQALNVIAASGTPVVTIWEF